jgi:methionyl-tRNA formyltransferase
MAMRVVLISQVAVAVSGYSTFLRALGHEPVALLCTRMGAERYSELEDMLAQAPAELDVVMAASRGQIAPLLRVYEPDLALCAGFPWKIPAEAIAVPKHGIVNGHPSLLPRYRGPIPVSWAIRNGETEIGFTFHYMDAELDTGGILAQTRIPLDDEHSWEELQSKVVAAVSDIFPGALERVLRHDPGDPQREEDASYLSFFEPEYAWIDWSKPAVEVDRQVRAWRFHPQIEGDRGALADLEGEIVRVLRVSSEPAAGRAMDCGDGTLWIVESEPA